MFGDGWTLDPLRNQYYFHRFYAEQPDLNHRNSDVVAETLDVLRFWLDEGVDGFRYDVIDTVCESHDGRFMLTENGAYIRRMREVLDAASVTAARAMVAEKIGRMGTYPKGAQPAQVIGSHDVVRAWSVGGGELWRSQSAALIEMTLKGTPFIYYGEELALGQGTQVIVDDRDEARTPMPWTRDPNGHGSTTGRPWIAFGEAAAETSVEAEDGDPASMLTFYRQLLALRRGHAVWATGELRHVPVDVRQVLAFLREDATESYSSW